MEERRVHRRTHVQRRIEVLPLEEPSGSTFKWMRSAPGSEAKLTPLSTAIPGHLIDIGCGGMCAVFAKSLEIGQSFEVHIRAAEGPVQKIRGAVRSALPSEHETFHGFSFDEPLLALGDIARRGPKIIDDCAVKPLVLVVDDEPDVRDMLDKFLTKRGLRVFPARGADEALEAIKHELPALMILDLRMPKVGGLELLETLERIGVRVPNVWAMSGYVSDEDARMALKLGASEFLNKPFDLDYIDYALRLLAPTL